MEGSSWFCFRKQGRKAAIILGDRTDTLVLKIGFKDLKFPPKLQVDA